MIIFNTTFHIYNPVVPRALDWIRDVYASEALKSGLFSSPLTLHILADIDPEASSYALQLQGQDLEKCRHWANTCGAELLAELHKCFGEQVLPFHTFMQAL